MKNITELLEAEMKSSAEFSRDNFGMMVGDGFRELVMELSKNSQVVAHLMMYLLASAMGSKDLADNVKVSGGNPAIGSIGALIPRHIETFRGPLEMLYWGIHIGRKLQEEETKTLDKLEGK